MSDQLPWEVWLRQENAARAAEGMDPLPPNSVVVLRRRLQGFSRRYPAQDLIERVDWVIEGYGAGYLSESTKWEEIGDFIENAQALIANEEAIENAHLLWKLLEQPTGPLSPAEEARRDEWQRQKAENEQRQEARRQRAALRDGAKTLTLIRRHLRGQAPSQPLASEPAKTSPTS